MVSTLSMTTSVTGAMHEKVSVTNTGTTAVLGQVEFPLVWNLISGVSGLALDSDWSSSQVPGLMTLTATIPAGAAYSFSVNWRLGTGLTTDDVVLRLKVGGSTVQTLTRTLHLV